MTQMNAKQTLLRIALLDFTTDVATNAIDVEQIWSHLHQGNVMESIDAILSARPNREGREQRDVLIATIAAANALGDIASAVAAATRAFQLAEDNNDKAEIAIRTAHVFLGTNDYETARDLIKTYPAESAALVGAQTLILALAAAQCGERDVFEQNISIAKGLAMYFPPNANARHLEFNTANVAAWEIAGLMRLGDNEAAKLVYENADLASLSLERRTRIAQDLAKA